MVAEDINFLSNIAEKFTNYFEERRRKKLKKKYSEAWREWNTGRIDEEGVEEVARELDVEPQNLAEFLYLKEMNFGIGNIRSFDRKVDEHEPPRPGKNYLHPDFFLRGAFPDYPKALLNYLEEPRKRFEKAERLAKYFDLGEKEENMPVKEIKRINKRKKIAEKMLEEAEFLDNENLEQMREIIKENYESLIWEVDQEAVKEARKFDVGFGSPFPMGVKPRKLSENEMNDYLIEEIEELHKEMSKQIGEKNLQELERHYEELKQIADDIEKVDRDQEALDEHSIDP